MKRSEKELKESLLHRRLNIRNLDAKNEETYCYKQVDTMSDSKGCACDVETTIYPVMETPQKECCCGEAFCSWLKEHYCDEDFCSWLKERCCDEDFCSWLKKRCFDKETHQCDIDNDIDGRCGIMFKNDQLPRKNEILNAYISTSSECRFLHLTISAVWPKTYLEWFIPGAKLGEIRYGNSSNYSGVLLSKDATCQGIMTKDIILYEFERKNEPIVYQVDIKL